jgi:acylphosphatase
VTTGDGETVSVGVSIEGRVQGVWFRGWMIREADSRNLSGWVRNRRDGTVEAVFAGPAEIVTDMVEACWNGPPAARVTAVRTAFADDPGEADFDYRPTV